MTVGAALKSGGSGRDLVAADVALGAGFGTAPVLTIRAGSNRSRGAISVEADATAAQATATVTVTFPEPFEDVPIVVVSRDSVDSPEPIAVTAGWNIQAVSKTAFTVVSNTIPVDTDDTGFAYVVVG